MLDHRFIGCQPPGESPEQGPVPQPGPGAGFCGPVPSQKPLNAQGGPGLLRVLGPGNPSKSQPLIGSGSMSNMKDFRFASETGPSGNIFKLDLYLTSHSKTGSSWVSGLNINNETTHVLRKNILILK